MPLHRYTNYREYLTAGIPGLLVQQTQPVLDRANQRQPQVAGKRPLQQHGPVVPVNHSLYISYRVWLGYTQQSWPGITGLSHTVGYFKENIMYILYIYLNALFKHGDFYSKGFHNFSPIFIKLENISKLTIDQMNQHAKYKSFVINSSRDNKGK